MLPGWFFFLSSECRFSHFINLILSFQNDKNTLFSWLCNLLYDCFLHLTKTFV